MRFQREDSPEILARNMGYQSLLFGRLSHDSEEESIADNVSNNEGFSNVGFDNHQVEADDNSFDELHPSHSYSIEEEGSISSSDVDLINNEFEVELSTPRR